MEITKKTTMGEMLDYDRGIAYVLMQSGMHCVGCPSSIHESLEDASPCTASTSTRCSLRSRSTSTARRRKAQGKERARGKAVPRRGAAASGPRQAHPPRADTARLRAERARRALLPRRGLFGPRCGRGRCDRCAGIRDGLARVNRAAPDHSKRRPAAGAQTELF